MNSRTLLLLAVMAAAAWSFRNWRSAIKAVMVLLILEGALRKWVLPGAQDLLYFAKDFLLVGAYLGYLGTPPVTRRFTPPPAPLLYGSLALAAVVGCFQILNPNLPNVLVGILGFKAYFLYVPLMFVLPAVFDDDRDLARFLKRYVMIAIPVGLLAIMQFLSPSGSALNTYARTDEARYIATFGSSTEVRVTGPFAFISGYTSYLLATTFLILAILGAMAWRFRNLLLVYAALALTLLGMLMSGSRGPVLVLLALLPVYWWFAVVRERGTGSAAGRFLLVVSVLLGLLIGLGDQALSAFAGRARGTADVGGRVASPMLAPFLVMPRVGILGFGIGSTHQTAAAVTKGIMPYSWLRGLLLEVESGKVMIELGPLGFLLVYAARILMAVFAAQQVLRLRTRFHRALATGCLMVFLAQIPGGIVFDVTAGMLYWFFGGLLMTAVHFDRLMTNPVPQGALPLISGGRPKPSLSTAAKAPALAGRRWQS